MSPKARRLGWISILETVSFIALLGAMVADSDRMISIIGATHGLLFLAYAILVWIDHEELGWGTSFAIGSIITGPIGAIVVLERLRREGPGGPPPNQLAAREGKLPRPFVRDD